MVKIRKVDKFMSIDTEIVDAFAELIGKPCCRKRVGHGRSLSIGFGEKVSHSKSKTVDTFYGEWEIGTYSSAWRIVSGNQIVCGSMNVVDSIEELDQELQNISLGAVVNIEAISPFDIRVNLDAGVFIDFIYASTDDDEMFHIFGPNSLYVEYKCADEWTVGKSNSAWKG